MSAFLTFVIAVTIAVLIAAILLQSDKPSRDDYDDYNDRQG